MTGRHVWPDRKPQEVQIATLPLGWQFRIAETPDGAPVLMGSKTVDGAKAPSQVKRQLTRALS